MNRKSTPRPANFATPAARVEAIEADLSTQEGVDKLYEAIRGRPVDALLANAGRGLGHGFLDQNLDEVYRLINTNVTGTLYLIHKVGNDMRRRGEGKILITGSIAGFMPGASRRHTTPARPSSIPSPRPCATN